MYIRVLKIKSINFFGEDYFKIHLVSVENKLKLQTLTIQNVLKCLENVRENH